MIFDWRKITTINLQIKINNITTLIEKLILSEKIFDLVRRTDTSCEVVDINTESLYDKTLIVDSQNY